MIHENEGLKVTYEDSPAAHKRAYDILKEWFLKEEMFSGESIQQMDVTYEDAPNLLTDIAEKAFKFDVTYKE